MLVGFFLSVSSIFIGYLFGRLRHFVMIGVLRLEGKQQIKGFHFHHSMLSIFLAIAVPFKTENLLWVVVLLGIAFGIILEHRLSWGKFYFLEKLSEEKK